MIVFDLEATCWETGQTVDRQEIIEIGAVRLGTPDEFGRFVRPVGEPTLSAFCTQLTGITQADVDPARTFPEVFPEFLAWIGDGALASWGAYDIKQLRADCRRHAIPFPERLADGHVNLKTVFADRHHCKPCGMAKALRMLRIPLDGTHHRAIDDARNIAKIAAVSI